MPSSGFEVKAFGRTGATAGKGERCYRKTPVYGKALIYEADVYVVMLGTNDAWHASNDPNVAELGLVELVRHLRRAVPGCAVALVQPPGCKDGRCIENLKSILHPAVKRVAAAEQTELVEPMLHPGRAYSKDQVHLSPQGAHVIAAEVAKVVRLIAERAFASRSQSPALAASGLALSKCNVRRRSRSRSRPRDDATQVAGSSSPNTKPKVERDVALVRQKLQSPIHIFVTTPLEDGSLDNWEVEVNDAITIAGLMNLWLADHEGVPAVVFVLEMYVAGITKMSRPRGDVEVRAICSCSGGAPRRLHLFAYPHDLEHAEKHKAGHLAVTCPHTA